MKEPTMYQVRLCGRSDFEILYTENKEKAQRLAQDLRKVLRKHDLSDHIDIECRKIG